MFDFDITNPYVQGMIQEEIDNNESEEHCPLCGLPLEYDQSNNTYTCTNQFCDYYLKPLTRHR